jgi:multidrug efflux system membrane fusion protein
MVSPGDGQVETLAVAEGSAVRTGQVLLQVDGARLRLERAKAEADLERARRAAELASAGESRRTRLTARDAALLSEEERQVAAARTAQALAEVGRAEAAMALATLAVDRAVVRAPCDGVVVGLEISDGQRVGAGRTLCTVLQDGPPMVAFRVPADLAGRIAPGDGVQVRPGGGGGIPATVTAVAPTADGSRQVQVRARLHAVGPRPGGLALVHIRLPLARGPMVPRTALRASERGMMAFVRDGERVRQRLVETGLVSDDGWCEVLDGLVAGEPVVVAGVDALRDGARVRVVAGP